MRIGSALRWQAMTLEQWDRFAEHISAQLWAHLDQWENEGGRCGNL